MQNTSKAAFFVAANEFQTKLIGGGKMTRYSAFKKKKPQCRLRCALLTRKPIIL